MTTTTPQTLGYSDYVRFCRALGLTPDDTLTPAARAASLPAWLTDEMIQTPAAAAKLRSWAQTTPREAWSEASDPAHVLVSLHAFGDPVMPHEISTVLCRLPAPVRAYVVARVTFVCVGRAFAGWCGPRFTCATPWLIVMSAREDPDALIAHEVAHSWLLLEPSPDARLMAAFTDWTIHDTPIAHVPPEALAAVLRERDASARHEREVHTLVAAWGFPDVA
jgi:hypothetical protein